MSGSDTDAGAAGPREDASGPVAAASGGAPAPRDAILYLPGLGRADASDGLVGAARRLADALDRQSVASFAASGVQEQKLWPGRTTRVVTISRTESGQPRPVADVYEVDYTEALSGGFEKLKPIWQALDIFGLLLLSARRLITGARRPGKPLVHKLQVAYAGGLFLVLAAYLPVVIVTAVSLVYGAVPTLPHYVLGVRGVFTLDVGRLAAGFQTAVVFLTAAGLFTKFSLKELVAGFAGTFTPALRYVAAGDRQGLVQGAVLDLINGIEDRQAAGGQAYARIHIVAYSFGSIVALDTLFPRLPPSPLLARVGTLVTIGCPFDFVRTYFPHYFEQRSAPAAEPTWYNVYDPVDVLSSDFRDGSARGRREARAGLGPQGASSPVNLPPYGAPVAGFLDWVLLGAFRRHAQYWERTEGGDLNCFDLIVPRLYPAAAAARP